MTDDAQQEVWRIDTRPFGEVEALTWTVENNQRFPGQYADAESGYSYNYFRDYEPTSRAQTTSIKSLKKKP